MSQSELLREIIAIQDKLGSDESKGNRKGLKAIQRKLYSQYMRTLAKTGEAA